MQVLIGDSFMDRKKRNTYFMLNNTKLIKIIKIIFFIQGEKGFCIKNTHKNRRRRYMKNGMSGKSNPVINAVRFFPR